MNKLNKLQIMRSYYPDATAELNYDTPFQLLIAVTLSAQTTDIAVNKVTQQLFEKYPDAITLGNANYDDIYPLICKIGLAKTKTKNIIKLSKIYNEEFNNIMPMDREQLVKLPGVGIKTANVCLANIYDLPYMAVDTHIERICKRCAITPENYNPLKIEKTLERVLKNENINDYHHSLIFFGRYHCKAQHPYCLDNECLLQNDCRYFKKVIKPKLT